VTEGESTPVACQRLVEEWSIPRLPFVALYFTVYSRLKISLPLLNQGDSERPYPRPILLVR